MTRFSLLLLSCLTLAAPALAADVEVELDTGSGFVIQNNGASVERLRVDEATGNISRNGALFVHTTNGNNTFIGTGAGNASTTGNVNTAFGVVALNQVTSGSGNSAFGNYALRDNATGIANSAFGTSALEQIIAGSRNSAFGAQALQYNNGESNSAFGYDALRTNIGGSDNSAFGRSALGANINGNFNAAFGHSALALNTAGISNAAFGRLALESNTDGSFNSAFGRGALDSNTTGSSNVAIGVLAGTQQTTGSNNIYIANQGVAAESGQIKIGTAGAHTHTHLVGEATLFDDAGSSVLYLGGNGTGGPHGLVLDDDTAEAGVSIFFRTSPNRLVIEKTSEVPQGDPADAFYYDRDTDDFYFGGAVAVQRTTPSHPLHVGTDTSNGNGAHVTAGGTWTNGSSRFAKEDFEAVDPEAILTAVASLPIAAWRYKDSDEGRHLGPVAEDFAAAFGLGNDERYIATVDADGVALAAIQGLHRLTRVQQSQIEEQQQVIAALEERLDALEGKATPAR